MIQQGTHATPRMDLGVAFHEFSSGRMRLIGGDVLPLYPAAKEAATLKVVKRKNLNIPETKHANGAAYNRVHLYMDDMSYACVDHGLEGTLTDRDREKFRNDFDSEVETVSSIKIKMLMARELRVRNLVFNTTTWTGASLYTDNSGSPWDNIATKIIAQVAAAKEKVRLGTGIPADSLVIGEAALQNLLKNTEIIARYPNSETVTEAMIRGSLAAIFGLQNLHVGQAVYNSADEGQDFSSSDMWGDDYAMVASLGYEGLPLTEPQMGRTIFWEQYIADLDYVEQYREEQTKSDVFRVEQSVDEKVIDPLFGHLMKIDA